MKKLIASLLIGVTVLMLGACATIKQGERKDDLWQALTSYRKLIRWGYYEDATHYQLPAGNYQTKLDMEYLKGVRITEYEELERVVTSEDSLDVHVKISFYHEDYGNVKTIRDVQSWVYVEEDKRWYLDDDLPDLSLGQDVRIKEIPRTRPIEIK